MATIERNQVKEKQTIIDLTNQVTQPKRSLSRSRSLLSSYLEKNYPSDSAKHNDMSFADDYTITGAISGHPKLLLVCNEEKTEFVVKMCELEEFNAECDAHAKLDKTNCPFIVKLQGFKECRISDTHGIILLPKCTAFAWDILRLHTKILMWQLLTAIKCCHENEIVHRDVKPSNILWYWDEGKPHILLSDFGLAIDPDTSDFELPAGTLSFMAPEALITRVPEAARGAIDIWSAGVILAELLLNVHPLFVGEKKSIVSQSIHTFLENKERAIVEDQKANDLLLKMLAIDYNERITAREALEHEYFDELNLS